MRRVLTVAAAIACLALTPQGGTKQVRLTLHEGTNIAVEWRFAEGRPDRLRGLATELVGLKVDVIVALSSPAVRAARQATRTIPIVAVDLESDPVANGWVESLARPGGNLTGFFMDFPEISGKRLELLKEAIPGLSRVAVFWDASQDPVQVRATEAAARSLGLRVRVLSVHSPRDIERTLSAAARDRTEVLMLMPSPLFDDYKARILELATRHRLPAAALFSFYVDTGALMSYGPNLDDIRRRSAVYVDKILKGAKPADLPIQRPTKFEFAINLRTAKALGLTIPPSMLVRADEVIR